MGNFSSQEHMVTDRLKAMTDEGREVDTIFKILKQGDYSKGLQKGLTMYDKDFYERKEEQELRDEMDKIIISLEKSQPKIKINTRKTKKNKDKSDVFTKCKKETDPKGLVVHNHNSSSPVQCLAYIQSGRQCSRKVRNSNKSYCGLHNILHYGDINTGYLIKNTI